MFFEEVKRTEGSHDEKKHAGGPLLSKSLQPAVHKPFRLKVIFGQLRSGFVHCRTRNLVPRLAKGRSQAKGLEQ
jgi:hypothetical protein